MSGSYLDFQFYLTSLEPDMAQTIYSQSIGGYHSSSVLYPETTLSTTMGLYETTMYLSTPSSGSWSEWSDVDYVNIGNEIIRVDTIDSGTVSILQRAVNGITSMHLSSDKVIACSAKNLLNDVFSEGYKQYRCIVMKNISRDTMGDPSVGDLVARNPFLFMSQISRNVDSIIKMAFEYPKNQKFIGESSSWTNITLTDTSLIGIYVDNYFINSYLRIKSGPNVGTSTDRGRIISSFDSATGVFVLQDSLPINYDLDDDGNPLYSPNIDYEIDPSPARRIKTGTESPSAVVSANTITDFAAYINANAIYVGHNLNPDDIIYIWIERTTKKGSAEFLANNIILTLSYTMGS